MTKPQPRREMQLSLEGAQRIYKATLAYGCLVLSWSGIESGLRAFTAQETRNLQQFLEQHKGEIGTGKDILDDKEGQP
jgi:hypothetical protein